MIRADVCVIGGGIVGTNILRVLSKYDVKSVLVEALPDIGAGITKGNGGAVHSGYDAKHGTLKAKLNVIGASMYAKLSEELDFPYQNIGTKTVGFNDEDRVVLEKLYKNGVKNKVPGLRIIEKEELLKMEPHVNPEATLALYAPSAGITDPYQVAYACAENAVDNGNEVYVNHKVIDIEKVDDGFIVITSKNKFHTKIVVNSAGVFGDVIGNMVDREQYKIIQRHGAMMIFERSLGFKLNSALYPTPGENTKGNSAIPTCSGNIMAAATAIMTEDKDRHYFEKEEIEQLFNNVQHLVPKFQWNQVIRVFNGLRPVVENSNNDFVIEESQLNPGFYNCIGIQSPGIAAAPAIGEYVVEMINERYKLKPNMKYNPYRKGIVDFSELTMEEQIKLVDEDSRYGNIICRCEIVSEAEIVDAINRPCGARTLDGVKRRTRAGMGRCQGGFCQPKVVDILHRETKMEYKDIYLEEEGSYVLLDLEGEHNV